MSIKDSVEYYEDGGKLVTAVKSSIVPLVGSLVSIRRLWWRVKGITYAVDFSDIYEKTASRVVIFIEKEPENGSN